MICKDLFDLRFEIPLLMKTDVIDIIQTTSLRSDTTEDQELIILISRPDHILSTMCKLAIYAEHCLSNRLWVYFTPIIIICATDIKLINNWLGHTSPSLSRCWVPIYTFEERCLPKDNKLIFTVLWKPLNAYLG